MPAYRPPDEPSFDAELFTERLYERVLQGWGYVILPDGTRVEVENDADPHAIFAANRLNPDGSETSINFRANKRWTSRQIKDGLTNHAFYIDDLVAKLAKLDNRESDHHSAQALRLAAIEAQLAQSPFPA